MKFDPMTGEPIVKEETKVKFDPMTGEPIQENPAQVVLEQHKKSTGKKITIVAIGIAAVVLVVLGLVFGGLFQSKQAKILKAVANTFSEQGKLAEACSLVGMVGTDDFTLSVKADVEGQEVDAAFASKNNEFQLSGIVDVGGAPEITGIIGIDSKEVRAKIDGLDTVLVYKFTEDNDGELMEEIPEETIEMINETLVMLTSEKSKNNVSTKVLSAALKEFNEWEIEALDKKSFKVDGKKQSCTGYRFKVEEDNMEDMSDAIVEALKGEVNDDLIDAYEDIMAEAFDGMPDVKVSVYIYKNKLAAVVLDMDGDEVEIFFEGGEYRTQNIVVDVDGHTVLELIGETKGSKEEYELELAGRKIFTMEYNEKSGELVMKEKYTGANICVEAILTSKSNELSFVLEDMDNDYYNIDCELEINLKKGASLQKIKGEEFDLGAADEDDMEDFVNDLVEALK